MEEEIFELELEAEKCGEEIERLTERRKELEELVGQKQMEALHQAVLKSGKTVEEVISLISSDGQAEM